MPQDIFKMPEPSITITGVTPSPGYTIKKDKDGNSIVSITGIGSVVVPKGYSFEGFTYNKDNGTLTVLIGTGNTTIYYENKLGPGTMYLFPTAAVTYALGGKTTIINATVPAQIEFHLPEKK
ncbi:MAG: hypothetical protein QXY61_01430 [Candidatus Anstonellales archaeon]